MDPERARIQADLQGVLDGDIRCDELFSQMYASDASVFEIRPLGIVRPKHLKDVVSCVKYANENNLPLIARGAGTGVSGESVGSGLILDFSYYMRRIVRVGDDTVRFQPGVILSHLNRQLAKSGRLFGPDPATRSVTTMGSVLALDASGSHWPKYGTASDKVISLQVVLGNGEVIQADKQNLTAFGQSNPAIDLARRIQHVLGRNKQAIDQSRPKTKLNRSGYHLHDLIEDGKLDLSRLIVGSEGTLALITEATVKTDPVPKHRGVVLLFFDRLEKAAQAAIETGELKAAACDLMDRRLLSIARENDRRYADIIPAQAEAMLLIEFDDDDLANMRERMQLLSNRIQRKRRLAFETRSTVETEERNFYWRLARRVVPRLYKLTGSERAIPFIEDIVVPPEQLPAFLTSAQRVLQKHEVTASFFAHAGHGQLHIRPFMDLATSDCMSRMQKLAVELYEQAMQVGGMVGGEHGDGLSRTWFLQTQFRGLYPVFREVKEAFDPKGILNPGKIVTDRAQPLTENFRRVVLQQPIISGGNGEGKKRDLPILNLNWTPEQFALEARSCNGCGRCRTTSTQERMCPIFRLAPAEEASPRAKANLMRAILTGSISAEEFKTDELKQIADLCVNCHQCRLECPAGVDIPKMMVEAKSQFAAINGLQPSESMMARIDGLCRLASRFESLSNWVIGNRTCRWILEKLAGISQSRKLPRLSRKPFMRIASKMRLTKPSRNSGRKIVYFVDTYANLFDTQLAVAFVKVMRHNGVEVYVHPAQRQSGMSLISLGALDRARKAATRNIEVLVDAVRQGYQVVATEPSAALCLRHEYLNLFDDDDARLVANHTSEACEYLWKMHEQGSLELDFKPVNAQVGYHLPCHQRALQIGAPGERLLRLIPGLTVERLEKGCSGMAGTYGLSRKNYRRSLRVGLDLINAVREPRITAGSTECSACKMQMEQGTNKGTIHPIKLLAHAYRLMPEFDRLLETKNEDLIVT